ncbi:hypothetical protein HY642_04065 [Candidatus Woesearchaeota archaeon]|nr:hypothetical protein [Candidatus Woesearchaeota archaeon]
MSVLAYSELLKRIAGINESQLEAPFKILSQNNTTKTRLAVIKGLANHEPISIGKLLQAVHLPRGGGSYMTIQKYFVSLQKAGLLDCRKIKNRTLWSFTKEGGELKRYILS